MSDDDPFFMLPGTSAEEDPTAQEQPAASRKEPADVPWRLIFSIGLWISLCLAWLFVLIQINVSAPKALVGAFALGSGCTLLILYKLYWKGTPARQVAPTPTGDEADQTLVLPVGELMATHTAQQHGSPVKPHPRTVNLARRNQRVSVKLIRRGSLSPGEMSKKLLPVDLEHVRYDERPHMVFSFVIFAEIFSPKKHMFRRAASSYFIWMLICIGASLALLRPDELNGYVHAAAITAICYVIFVALCVMYALNGVRLVMTEHKLVQYRDSWPFLHFNEADVYNVNLTETILKQSRWGRVLRFGLLIIETTEHNPSIKSWQYARFPHELHAMLQAQASKKPLT